MFCSKCGMKMNEGDKICTNCKTPLQAVAYEFDMSTFDLLKNNNQNIKQDNITDDTQTPKCQSGRKRKVISKKAIVAIIISVLCVFPVLFVIANINREKRLNEYIEKRTITLDEDDFVFLFVGYDGYGTPSAYADINKVFDALMPALGFEENNGETGPVMRDIYDHIDVTFDERKNLSNGQQITVSIDIDTFCLEKYDVYFNDTEYQITVSGLKEIQYVDIFEDLHYEIMEKDGVKSIAYVHSEKYSIFLNSYIKCSPQRGLNYGEKFVLSIDVTKLEELREKFGIQPVYFEKEYVLLEDNEES